MHWFTGKSFVVKPGPNVVMACMVCKLIIQEQYTIKLTVIAHGIRNNTEIMSVFLDQLPIVYLLQSMLLSSNVGL